MDWWATQKAQRVALQPWSNFILCIDADLLLAWHQHVGCQGTSKAHLGCLCSFDIFYDHCDGSLQVGQKVDADQNLDWDVGVWRVTVDLFILLVCVLIWIAWIAMALA